MTLRYGHLIRVLENCASQATTNALADLGLTAAQGHIMGFITHRQTPPCARDIEEFFQLSHPTVSGLLSRLEKKGFIEFLPDEADRRCKRIYLLPKGKELDETMSNTIRSTEEKLVSGFSDEEKAQFHTLLQRAIYNLDGQVCRRKSKEESNP